MGFLLFADLPAPVWFLGFRFGEALHPGPGPATSLVTVAVINPTTVLHKAEAIASVQSHLVLAAETAATTAVQQLMNSELRMMGFHSHWSSPVPDRFHPGTAKPGLRGAAMGTAAFSLLPSRGALTDFTPEQLGSCRISECLVRFNAVEVRCITLYGYPRCLPFAAERTNHLLSWAFNRACESSIPCLIGGDFNMDPTSLPSWAAFAGRGWQELGSLTWHATGKVLPATCKNATRFDSILLSPSLPPFFDSADVMVGSGLFDAHSPVRLHLRMPGVTVAPWIWQLPQSWTSFPVQSDVFQKQYGVASAPVRTALHDAASDDLGAKLRLWSSLAEEAMHCALAACHEADP